MAWFYGNTTKRLPKDFKSLNTQRTGMLHFFLKLEHVLRKIIKKKYFGILAGY